MKSLYTGVCYLCEDIIHKGEDIEMYKIDSHTQRKRYAHTKCIEEDTSISKERRTDLKFGFKRKE